MSYRQDKACRKSLIRRLAFWMRGRWFYWQVQGQGFGSPDSEPSSVLRRANILGLMPAPIHCGGVEQFRIPLPIVRRSNEACRHPLNSCPSALLVRWHVALTTTGGLIRRRPSETLIISNTGWDMPNAIKSRSRNYHYIIDGNCLHGVLSNIDPADVAHKTLLGDWHVLGGHVSALPYNIAAGKLGPQRNPNFE